MPRSVRSVLALLLLAVTLVAPTTSPASAATPLPAVLPAVRSWQPAANGQYQWLAESRIVVESTELRADADTFAEDLSYLFGTAPVVADAPATTGDVVLRLDPNATGDEAYTVTLGATTTITAKTAVGVYWGTRTMLQLLKRQPTLPAGVIADAPQYKSRGLLLSIARMPVSWLDNILRDMSYLKLNELTLNSLNMTDADITAVEAIAQRRHVKLIGWVNAPKFATGYIPAQYRLVDKAGATDPINLDTTNAAGVTWANTEVDRHASRFPSDTFNIGGDEWPRYNLRADKVTINDYPGLYNRAQATYNEAGAVQDTFRAYMNKTNGVLKAQGKTTRMWSDDITAATKVKPDADLVMMHWINYGLTPTQLAANGNMVINSNLSYLYFNLGTAENPPDRIWNEFDTGTFHGGLKLPGGATDPHLAGLQFCVWTSGAVYDAGRLERDLSVRLRPLAQKAWGTTPVASKYADALPTINAVGRAPGVLDTPRLGDVGLGATPSGPAVRFNASQQLFTTSPTGALRHSFWSEAQGQVGEDLLPANSVTGRPLAFTNPDGRLSAFTRTTTGTVRETSYLSGTGWKTTDWSAAAQANGFGTFNLGGDLAGFSYGAERHVFGADTDGNLTHLWYSPGDAKIHGDRWGGKITGTPVAFVWGRTQVVYARGANGNLQRWWWQPTDTSDVQREDLGIPVAANTKIAGWTTNGTRKDTQSRDVLTARQTLAVVDPTGRLKLWALDLDGDRPTTRDLTTEAGVTATGSPAGYADAAGNPVIYVRRASDQHLIRIRVPQTGVPTVKDLTTVTPGTQVTPTGDPDGLRFDAELHVFAPGTGLPRHHWWSSPADTPQQDNWN
ncbi:glycoside hydrolase family 20 zincin-like fold domain-containing protein [Kribbella sp. NPDC051587]|uniref:glycoside hydrolase family 20 zincin-like fold domain-containing protein n=1 Tax=Kribbella sp. NPDC051587 TaxID=3364119 RepID=UPI0037A73E99